MACTGAELTALQAEHRQRRAALLAALMQPSLRPQGVRRILRALSQASDALLRALWRRAGIGGQATLLATGGYGRRQLFPHSDVDVLVLVGPGAAMAAIERFIACCWDAGLRISSSVRTLPECLQACGADLTLQTALLEARRLAGSTRLFAELQEAHARQLDVRAFMQAKLLELHQRHTRHEHTPYALEPDCKESPGGLRDLHLVLWLARAAHLGTSWRELAARGLATAYELRQLQRNEAVLWLIRARLHVVAGRHEDRLVFDLQAAVAQAFGLVDTQGSGGRLLRASEQLMRRYYWAAKAVSQLSQILLLEIEERVQPTAEPLILIDAEFLQKGSLLEIARPDLYQRRPQAIVRTFLRYQSTPGITGLSVQTLRALYNARPLMGRAFREDQANRACFMQILRQGSGVTHALRLMNQTSVLGRLLAPFRRIVGRMQHDLFHAYTVDQHILTVVRNLRRFFMPEHAHEYPQCSQLATGWDKPWLLTIAALFHDIGKGRGGSHSQIGAREVARFCRHYAAHGITAEDAALVEFLVADHLLMSQVAQKQDLSDPAVIARFARRVGSARRLAALYLLTVADIRGTGPRVWSAWKGKLLEDLYHATLAMLGGRTPDAATEIEERKRDARVVLALHALPAHAHERLWQTLDVGYFLRHDAGDIAWHTRQLWQLVGARAPVVRARKSLAGEGLQVLVYTPDQSELFLRICGYFDRADFSVLAARIHTTLDGHALDTFQVMPRHAASAVRELITLVENELPLAIDLTAALPRPRPMRLSRRARSFPIAPRVSLRPDERGERWILSLSATDRAGLLYLVAQVLARHGLSVQLAKVGTLGERVEDSFVLSGEALQSGERQLRIEQELLRVLAQH
ncbi:[protein-PII] uridylyltransferase [Comamonas sp. NLF-1-9]|uniref:[protein-PII] uridylyltransferase n=1 Tax=Comamonas sp. NLF-1-9 TaxID=2853163 RepID=UPI001C47F4C0|nr:[protein-PII] uridylyltransferase [Comamonas sp. NLF-1-9]QXL83207.1 [protein-PII] uridylyltransferase [Comamonas sp. NLF-1-9]